ncbi:hypothetical protein LP415_11675 [Polaromonas sp. P1(28)-8]|nr:hypothetical protein LP415_11675 [Polaromonas sp. P1(28)-8]
MEIFILSFSAGIVACMVVVALVRKFVSIIFALALVALLCSLWYGWAVYGAEYVAEYWSKQESAENSKTERANSTDDIRNAESPKPPEKPSKLATLGQAGDLFGG